MTEDWLVVINGEEFVENTVRAHWAIRKALLEYQKKNTTCVHHCHHVEVYKMIPFLNIAVKRKNGEKFPVSKIT